MPASPEVLNANCTVGIHEVFLELEAEHQTEADSHIRIAREIVVNLEQVGCRAEPRGRQSESAHVLREQNVGDLTHGVCDEYLLCQTADKTSQTARDLPDILVPVGDLTVDIAVLYDGTRDKLREEGYVE